MRRIFFIFFALLVPFTLVSNPRQPFSSTEVPGAFTPFEENGKVGLKNEQGQIVIPAQYESIGWSGGSFSLIGNVTGYRSKGLWGLINTQNNKVTRAEYEELYPAQGEIIVARKKLNGSVSVRSGCINLSGKQIVPFVYDGIRIESFRAIVYTRSGNQFKHGLIDLDNRVLIPLNYQRVFSLGSLRFAVENVDGKIAIFSEDGKQLSAFSIDSLSAFKNDYAVIYQDQHQGLINRNGEVKLEPVFNEVRLADDGSILTRLSNHWQIVDGQNRAIREFDADSIVVLGHDLLKVTRGGRFELTRKDFTPITKTSLAFIGAFTNGKASFSDGNRAGVINTKGEVLVKPLYEQVRVQKQNVIAQMVTDKRFVLLDTTGRALTFRSYDVIMPFNGKFFPAMNRSYWGALDSNGKEIIACTHDSIGQVAGNLIVVKFRGKYGVINLDEDWIVTPQQGKIELVDEQRYLVQAGKIKFLKSFKGEIIYFSENPLSLKGDVLIESLQSGSYLKISMQGVIIDRFDRPEAVQEMFEESEGLLAIRKDNRYGFVDSRGRLRIANRYENVRSFKEGLAPVMILGRWGFINHSDQIAVQPVYDHVEQFNNGFSIVKQRDAYGLIDKSGKLVLPVRYESVEVLPDKKIKVRQNGMWGLAENNGRIILHPKFETLRPLSNGYAIVSQNRKFGVVSLDGLSTIPQMYDGIAYDEVHNVFMAMHRSNWVSKKIN